MEQSPSREQTLPPDRKVPPEVPPKESPKETVVEPPPIVSTLLRKRCLCPGVDGKETIEPTCAGQTNVCTLAGAPLFRPGSKKTALVVGLADVVKDETKGVWYVSDAAIHSIWEVKVTGQASIFVGGLQAGDVDDVSTEALFRSPLGLAIHDGFLYVADNGNHKIRRVHLNSKRVETWAGTGQGGMRDGIGKDALFLGPAGIDVGGNGSVYVVDSGNHRIREILSDRTVRTLAGGTAGMKDGAGKVAQFRSPIGVVAMKDGTLYVTDSGNNRIRTISKDGSVSTLTGGQAGNLDGHLEKALFRFLGDITGDRVSNLYVANRGNHSLRQISLGTQKVTTLAGGKRQGFLDATKQLARFSFPLGLDVGEDGTLWVTDPGNRRVRQVTSTGDVTTVLGNGPPGYLDGKGGQVFFASPQSLTWDGKTFVYLVEKENHRVRRISFKTGETSFLAGSGDTGLQDGALAKAQFFDPAGIAFYQNRLYIADTSNQAIRVVDLNQERVSTLSGGGGGGAKDGSLQEAKWRAPVAIVSDGKGMLYVADKSNHTIRRISLKTKMVTTIAGASSAEPKPGFADDQGSKARFNAPAGLYFHEAGGKRVLYVADQGNHSIREISLDSAGSYDVRTIVGNGTPGFVDGAALKVARLRSPSGVVFFQNALYIADTGNHHLRKLKLKSKSVSTIGAPSAGYLDGAIKDARFEGPHSLLVVSYGGQSFLLVVDVKQHAVRRWNFKY